MTGELRPWREQAEESALLDAAESWGRNREAFLEAALPRLPETVRLNPLRSDARWTADHLIGMGGERLRLRGVDAWRLPWKRGEAPPEHSALFGALHASGRVTRQEAASMLPPLLLDADPGDLVLDLCAAPGSKATQIAEAMGGSGAVIANEKDPGRTNTLVTNVRRIAAPNIVVARHDGRQIPKPPLPGFDSILVDAPCSGSGTTRKNPEVWGRWSMASGRGIHALQVDLLKRAVDLVRPGGRVVYSTCAFDPHENEAVVCEVLKCSSWMKIEPLTESIRSLPFISPGLHWWPEMGEPLDSNDADGTDGESEHAVDSALLSEVAAACGRVWPDDDPEGTMGGFFLAVLRARSPDEVEHDVARALRGYADNDDEIPPSGRFREHDIRAAASGVAEILEEVHGIPSEDGALWSRGKRTLWSHGDLETRVHDARWPAKRGRWHAGGQWRPLQVVLAGMPAFEARGEGPSRVISDALPALPLAETKRVLRVEEEVIHRVLEKERLPVDEVDNRLADATGGGFVLIADVDGYERRLPIWVGEWVTPMWREAEGTVLRAALGVENPTALDDGAPSDDS